MECFDVSRAINAVIGASLIVAGGMLMSNGGRVSRGYGAYCFAFGYFLLGLAAAERDVTTFDPRHRRFLIGVGSAAAIVAGTFMMYYHVQKHLHGVLEGRYLGKDVLKSIPIIDHILVYGGFIGLVFTIAMRDDGSFNIVKGLMAAGAVAVIGYSKHRMLSSMAQGHDTQKHQLAHILSWGLLVLAIAYSC